MSKIVNADGYFFDEVTHIGGYKDTVWPSVTQLLTEFCIQNFSGVPADRLEYKRILGTRVHAGACLLDDGILDTEHFNSSFPDCVGYLNAYRKFREIEPFETLVKERRLFSPTWRIHGAMDLVASHSGRYAGNLCIIDYKCTWALYAACAPQLCGYEMLVKENWDALGLPQELKRKKIRLFALQLKGTGNYEFEEIKNKEECMQDFMACARIWWRRVDYYKTKKGEIES